jgi:hypothetical protein
LLLLCFADYKLQLTYRVRREIYAISRKRSQMPKAALSTVSSSKTLAASDATRLIRVTISKSTCRPLTCGLLPSMTTSTQTAIWTSEQKELDKQIGGFFELADLLKNAETSGLTANLIDRLIDRIRVFKDRSIEVDFSFESGFDLIAEVTGDE